MSMKKITLEGVTYEYANNEELKSCIEKHPSLSISQSAEIGDNAKIGKYAEIGWDAVIGERAKIGNNATISKGIA